MARHTKLVFLKHAEIISRVITVMFGALFQTRHVPGFLKSLSCWSVCVCECVYAPKAINN